MLHVSSQILVPITLIDFFTSQLNFYNFKYYQFIILKLENSNSNHLKNISKAALMKRKKVCVHPLYQIFYIVSLPRRYVGAESPMDKQTIRVCAPLHHVAARVASKNHNSGHFSPTDHLVKSCPLLLSCSPRVELFTMAPATLWSHLCVENCEEGNPPSGQSFGLCTWPFSVYIEKWL